MSMSRKLSILLSAKQAGVVTSAAALLFTGYAGQNYVGPDQFGLRETFSNVTSDILPSGMYVHVPFVQYTHSYQRNTQRIVFNAGSCRFFPGCNSTGDQNPLVAEVAFNYQVEQNPAKLALYRWSMDGWQFADGYWLLTELMNDSANAVMGRRPLAATMSVPDRFLREFTDDIKIRFEQNNVPVIIESIELHGFKTRLPTNMPAYNVQRIESLNFAPGKAAP